MFILNGLNARSFISAFQFHHQFVAHFIWGCTHVSSPKACAEGHIFVFPVKDRLAVEEMSVPEISAEMRGKFSINICNAYHIKNLF